MVYAGSGIDGGVHGEGVVAMEVKTVGVQDWGLGVILSICPE